VSKEEGRHGSSQGRYLRIFGYRKDLLPRTGHWDKAANSDDFAPIKTRRLNELGPSAEEEGVLKNRGSPWHKRKSAKFGERPGFAVDKKEGLK